MRWKEIFDTGIRMGLDSDIRNKDKPGSYKGGYSDCMVIYGDADREVNSAYIAIDAGVPELLVVNELNKQGKKIDGIIAHHPAGAGCYDLIKVVEIQKYNWIRNGVKAQKTEKIYDEMISEQEIGFKAGNHLAVGNAASLLDIPFLCMHTAVDNIVQVFFEGLIGENDYRTISNIFDEVNAIPECTMAAANGDGPYIIGDRTASPGKIMVDMTGGVDPDSSIFMLLAKAGINTLIAMHYSMDNIKAIKKNRLNAVITGHMASDSIGLNIYCDRLESSGVRMTYGSGLYRHKRPSGPGGPA